MANETKEILRILGPLTSLGNAQIGCETSNDPVLGFKMWGGKDANGNVSKFLVKDKPASVSTLKAIGATTTGSVGFVKHDENGNFSGGHQAEVPNGYRGTWNATTNTPTLPTPDSDNVGYYYWVAVAGTYESISYEVGDYVISNGVDWEKQLANQAPAHELVIPVTYQETVKAGQPLKITSATTTEIFVQRAYDIDNACMAADKDYTSGTPGEALVVGCVYNVDTSGAAAIGISVFTPTAASGDDWSYTKGSESFQEFGTVIRVGGSDGAIGVNIQQKIDSTIYDIVFSNKETYPVYTTREGVYLNNDGLTETVAAGFNITEVDTETIHEIEVYGYVTPIICSVSFRDASNNLVGGLSIATGAGYATFKVKVPEGAVKAFTSYSTNVGRTYYWRVWEGVTMAQAATEDVETIKISKSEAEYTTTEDTYLSTDGFTETILAGFNITEINVTGVYEIEVYGFRSSVMCGLSFRDSNNNTVGEIYTQDSSDFTTFKVKVPEGAVKAFTSYSTTSDRLYYWEVFKGVEINTYLEEEKEKGLNTLKNVTMIPIFGQSLSIGAAAVPPITTVAKYPAGIMFNGGVRAKLQTTDFFTDFESLIEEESSGLGETVASGCMEGIVEYITQNYGITPTEEYWNNHKLLFVACGEGSKSIDDLINTPSGYTYYDGLIASIEGAKKICNERNLTLHVPCWIWIQGETDQSQETTYTTYKNTLEQLALNIDTDVKNITSQTEDVKCVCYQTNAQNIVATTKEPTYTNDLALAVPNAQVDLIKESDYFIGANPVYVLEHSADLSQRIHLSAEGSKMMGHYMGFTIGKYLMTNQQHKGVHVESYTVNGNNIELTMNTPCTNLGFSNEWIANVPNQGFNILNSGNTEIISSISVYDKIVTIECTEDPTNARIFYGFNGTAYYDGRKLGSRGLLRDMQHRVKNCDIGGTNYTLSNYAYCFDFII